MFNSDKNVKNILQSVIDEFSITNEIGNLNILIESINSSDIEISITNEDNYDEKIYDFEIFYRTIERPLYNNIFINETKMYESFKDIIVNLFAIDSEIQTYIIKYLFIKELKNDIDMKNMIYLLSVDVFNKIVTHWNMLSPSEFAVYYDIMVKGKEKSEQYYDYILNLYRGKIGSTNETIIPLYDFWVKEKNYKSEKQKLYEKHKDVIDKINEELK